MYPLIGAFPSSGTLHVIATLLSEIEVVGVDGLPGIVAASMLTSADIAEYPTLFLAST
jgi:hypothetical protein